jgi:hypothetical protein
MEEVEIQKQQVLGWAVVIRKDGDVPYKCLEPIVLSVDGVGECCIDEKNDRVEGDIAGILPAAPGTYRITTLFGNDLVVLGISHPGDGIPESEWLYAAQEYVA